MKIILASQSPRRKELLEQFGIEFEAIPSHIEENVTEYESPPEIVMGLAFEKAMSLAIMHPDAIIIASDTIVYDDEVLGKPEDEADAIRMLKQLNGKSHKVFTGLAVLRLSDSKKIIDYTETDVTFVNSEESTIIEYVKTKDPLDKAGAYGIQGLGSLLVESINGDYYSVMGMPLSKLNIILKRDFDVTLKF